MTLLTSAAVPGPTKETAPGVWSPQLRNRRDVDIYLPASYGDGRRYPVIYMHDGQNLTDPSTAFAGTWGLDDVLARLADRRTEPIAASTTRKTGSRSTVRLRIRGTAAATAMPISRSLSTR